MYGRWGCRAIWRSAGMGYRGFIRRLLDLAWSAWSGLATFAERFRDICRLPLGVTNLLGNVDSRGRRVGGLGKDVQYLEEIGGSEELLSRGSAQKDVVSTALLM